MSYKHYTAILSFMLFCTFSYAQESIKKMPLYFNFGIKGGFSSTIYSEVTLKIDDVSMKNYMQETSRVGFFGTFFARMNMNRNFLQCEVTYNVSKYTVSFDKNGRNAESSEKDFAQYSLTNRAIEIPLFYGYNFVKTGPYKMCVFGGPKAKINLRGISKQTYANFDQQNISENIKPVSYSATIGLGINISKIFFDFTYEFGIQNVSDSFTTDDPNDKIEFDRRKNVLGFSLGLLL